MRSRRSTPSSPRTRTAPEAPEAAYAAVLCYQNIYERDAQGRRRQEGRAATSPAPKSKKDGKKADEAREVQARRTSPTTRRAWSRPSIGTSATSSRREGDKQAQEQLRRGEVRPRAHLLRGAALGGGRARLPRRRAELRRQGRRHLRLAALSRGAQRARHALRAAEARVLRRHGAGRPEVHRALLQGRRTSQKNAEQCTTLTKIQCDIAAPQGAEAGRARRPGGGTDALKHLREGRQRRTSSCGGRTAKSRFASEQPEQCEKMRRDRLQRGPRLPGGAPHRQGDPGRRTILHRPAEHDGQDATLAKKARLRDRR